MNNTKQKIIEIISTFTEETNLSEINQIDKALHLIMSHSQQVILFISSIEDEFDIEFDDEEVHLDNFLNFTNLIKLVESYI